MAHSKFRIQKLISKIYIKKYKIGIEVNFKNIFKNTKEYKIGMKLISKTFWRIWKFIASYKIEIENNFENIWKNVKIYIKLELKLILKMYEEKN